jgi:hypothetical protein
MYLLILLHTTLIALCFLLRCGVVVTATRALLISAMEQLFAQLVDVGRFHALSAISNHSSDPRMAGALSMAVSSAVSYVADTTRWCAGISKKCIQSRWTTGQWKIKETMGYTTSSASYTISTTTDAGVNMLPGASGLITQAMRRQLSQRSDLDTVPLKHTKLSENLQNSVVHWIGVTYPGETYTNMVPRRLQSWPHESKDDDKNMTSFDVTNLQMFAIWAHQGDVVFAHYDSSQESLTLRGVDRVMRVLIATAHTIFPSVSLSTSMPRVARRVGDLILSYRSRDIVGSDRLDARWMLHHMEFEEQEQLQAHLESFTSRDSMDPYGCNKLGILAAGSEGTGKSLLLAVLANHLQQDALVCDLSTADDREELKNAYVWAVQNNYIIRFDEFDFMLESMAARRASGGGVQSGEEAREKQLHHLRLLMTSLKGVDDNEYRTACTNYSAAVKVAAKLPPDEGFIQTMLDDGTCTDGRVSLATTNFPERIPSAMMRPGRFDICLHLGKLPSANVDRLVRKMYKTELSLMPAPESPAYPDRVWSPAQIVMTHQRFRNYQQTAQHLATQLPKNFVTVVAEANALSTASNNYKTESISKLEGVKRTRTLVHANKIRAGKRKSASNHHEEGAFVTKKSKN